MPRSKSQWMMAGALAVSLGLVIALALFERSGREARLAEEAEDLPEALESLHGEEALYAVFLEADAPEEATAEVVLTPEERTAMRRQFLGVALYQRRQLEKLYLEVVRRLFERNSRYISLLEGRSGWPYDQFEIDFRTFQADRARFRRALTDEDLGINALIKEAEEELTELLSSFALQPGAFPEGRKRLEEKFRQLDEAFEGGAETETGL